MGFSRPCHLERSCSLGPRGIAAGDRAPHPGPRNTRQWDIHCERPIHVNGWKAPWRAVPSGLKMG
jgi:hypothetical protein